MKSLLHIKNLSMAFGGVQALFSVNLTVRQGEIFSLIGPNGSGKSTTLNCINGYCRPPAGEIVFKGRNLIGKSTHHVASRGIARTFQNLELFNHMQVIDNVLVGLHIRIKGRKFLQGIFKGRFIESWEWSRDRAFEIMDFLGISSFHNKTVGSLPFGIQKMVELARALCMGPDLLLLDEPSAGMNEQETHELAKLIQDIRDAMGITILMVEHDMNLVLGISDRICVLDSGNVIFTGLPQDASRHEKVIAAYMGEDEDHA